jgi:hypothetical protein
MQNNGIIYSEVEETHASYSLRTELPDFCIHNKLDNHQSQQFKQGNRSIQ